MPARRVALIVAFVLFLQMLDGAIIATSLPQMARDFGIEPLQMSVGVTTYLLTSAIFIPIAGWLADRFGAVRVFLFAIVLFTASSAACGLAGNLEQFVAARAVQGIGGAFMIPVGRLIAIRSADKAQMLEVMALITWPALLAPVIGPTLGGAITSYFSWRWNFLMNLPLGIAVFLAVIAFVRDSGEPKPRRLDWLGFVLCGTALAGLLLGLESFVHFKDAAWQSTLLVGIGLGAGVLAIFHLRRVAHPLLDLAAFKKHTFAMSNLFAGSYARIAINAMPFLLPLFFQVVYGLDPLQAGSLTMGYFIGNLVMKSVTTPILRRFGFRAVLIVNGVLAAVCIALCAALTPGTPLPIILAVLLPAGLTRSMQFTALSSLSFADIDAEARSSATTLSSMLQQLAMVFGVAFAALTLDVSSSLQGHTTLAFSDFQITFLVVAAVALLSAVLMRKLDQNAGAEISGRRTAAILSSKA